MKIRSNFVIIVIIIKGAKSKCYFNTTKRSLDYRLYTILNIVPQSTWFKLCKKIKSTHSSIYLSTCYMGIANRLHTKH